MNEMVETFTQFGAAGLIGLLWVYERRQAVSRERQLDEAHRKVVQQDHDGQVLTTLVKENTRALSALQQTQMRLVELLTRFHQHEPGEQ